MSPGWSWSPFGGEFKLSRHSATGRAAAAHGVVPSRAKGSPSLLHRRSTGPPSRSIRDPLIRSPQPGQRSASTSNTPFSRSAHEMRRGSDSFRSARKSIGKSAPSDAPLPSADPVEPPSTSPEDSAAASGPAGTTWSRPARTRREDSVIANVMRPRRRDQRRQPLEQLPPLHHDMCGPVSPGPLESIAEPPVRHRFEATQGASGDGRHRDRAARVAVDLVPGQRRPHGDSCRPDERSVGAPWPWVRPPPRPPRPTRPDPRAFATARPLRDPSQSASGCMLRRASPSGEGRAIRVPCAVAVATCEMIDARD